MYEFELIVQYLGYLFLFLLLYKECNDRAVQINTYTEYKQESHCHI